MLDAGYQLAHFRVIRLLGAGGMGEVYLAEDTRLGRKVAVKTLLPGFFDDTERRERFYREARTAAQVAHANVMAIYEIGSVPDPATAGDLDYIVMEYIEGKTLSAHLQEIGPDMKGLVRVAEQIASGLAAAHKMNVVHRDIKADNIIINNDGVPKILDFGLAKPVAPPHKGAGDEVDTISKELTQAGKIVGTVSYMSPEQIRGEAVDTRSDVFSFGILLYRMVTGELPFDGGTQVSTLAKILEGKHDPPHVKNDKIPPELERIIDKCLQKDANDRYQDTRDLVVDLRNLRRRYESDISSITAEVARIAGGTDTTAGSRKRWKPAVIVVVPILIAAVLLWRMFLGPGAEQRSTVQAGENALAILAFENKTGEDTLQWLQTGLPEILVTDLAQSLSLSIISRDRVIDYLHTRDRRTGDDYSPSECLDGARDLGAKHVLSGAYYRLGNNVRIDARMEEIGTGRIMLTEKVVGQDLFAMVDSLTTKIAQSLNLEDKSAAGVKTYTSSSPEAYKIYLAALEQFENERYDEAVAGFERAIAMDSTFALPYMRIGMARTFQGRQQEGARWFTLAKRYQDKLPGWEATLLDIYSDIWIEKKFDDAFVKMEMLIKNHPNDKESRFIYAILIYAFTRDTTRAFAQLDTALSLDPQYLLALTTFAEYYGQLRLYDKAIEYAARASDFHPDSPTPAILLARLYTLKGQPDLAIKEYEELLARHPKQPDALISLTRAYISRRDFARASQTLERLKTESDGNPYLLSSYYDELANLSNWRGKFRTSIKERFISLEYAVAAKDSTLITTKYSRISDAYDLVDMNDSCIDYSRRGFGWGSPFQRFDYPLTLVVLKPNLADSAEKLMQKTLTEAKSRLPSESWPIIDAIEQMFQGYRRADTAAVIAANLKLTELNPEGNESSEREAGYLAARTGRFAEARRLLSTYASGELMTTSGSAYPMIHYHLGMAEEGLGDKSAAIAHFQEMLRYWGSPEVEIKEIADARKRLARLTAGLP